MTRRGSVPPSRPANVAIVSLRPHYGESMTPLFDPADFHLLPGTAHVCAGGETAALRAHGQAMLRYLVDKSSGLPGRTRQETEIEAARAGIAGLWGVSSTHIGFVSNVAEGVSIVA